MKGKTAVITDATCGIRRLAANTRTSVLICVSIAIHRTPVRTADPVNDRLPGFAADLVSRPGVRLGAARISCYFRITDASLAGG
jgi:hypothetical protein